MLTRRDLMIGAAGAGFAANLPAFAQPAPKRGGDAIVGIYSPIPSLDIMGTTDDVGRIINLTLYEALVTRDENLQPSAGLADSWTISPDGLRYVFKLRQGVKFHNGKEMTSADVKASIDRYRRMALRKRYLAQVADVAASGKYEVTVTLNGPQPLFLNNFSQPEVLVAILPEEDGNKDAGKTSLIGTGPYKLAENVSDSHIKLARFDDYALDTRYPGCSGYGGRKDALFDSITFRIIPEPNAMIAALEAGEIHFADVVQENSVPDLKKRNDIDVIVRFPTSMNTLALNLSQKPMDRLEFRQALEAALDMDEILDAATSGNYKLSPYWQYPGYPTYPDSIKAPLYNIKDPAKAKELLGKAGYKGEPIRIMSATSFPWSSNTALVIAEQWKGVGINAQIDVMDWPAVVARRVKTEGWHVYPGQFGTGPWLGDPVLAIGDLGTATSDTHREFPELTKLVNEMQYKPTPEERQAAWLQAQQFIFDNVPTIKLGDVGQTQAARKNIVGFKPFRTSRFWGVGFA